LSFEIRPVATHSAKKNAAVLPETGVVRMDKFTGAPILGMIVDLAPMRTSNPGNIVAQARYHLILLIERCKTRLQVGDDQQILPGSRGIGASSRNPAAYAKKNLTLGSSNPHIFTSGSKCAKFSTGILRSSTISSGGPTLRFRMHALLWLKTAVRQNLCRVR
jgi:hypothetical protein